MSAERREKKGRFVMTMSSIVTDEQLGKYFRKMTAIRDRLGKSLPFEKVMHALQDIHDGKFDSLLKIDRTKPFDFSMFAGSENPEQGQRIIEQDKNAFFLKLIDCREIVLTHEMHGIERSITGEERIKRLIPAGHIRLDAQILFILLENPHLIPESWKCGDDGNPCYIAFDGTIIESNGVRHVFYCYWAKDKWQYSMMPLHARVGRDCVSAIFD